MMSNAEAKAMLDRIGAAQRSKGLPASCPRCGRQAMREPIHTNALSRYADCYICPDCGTDEALRDYRGNPLPATEWSLILAMSVLN